MALHACSYFALWETFSLATVANLSTSERSVPIPPLQWNMCTALLLHPAHLIIRVLWGMSGCIHPATARPDSILYPLIALHYEGMCRQTKVPVKVFSLVSAPFMLHCLIKSVYSVNACAIMGTKLLLKPGFMSQGPPPPTHTHTGGQYRLESFPYTNKVPAFIHLLRRKKKNCQEWDFCMTWWSC